MNFIQQNKFYLPEDAAHYIQRENLIDKFSKLSEYRIVLVSAGPGFGKSLSTANILEGMGQDFAWLSLSPEDDYFNRFVKYLVQCVRTRESAFGTELLDLLDLSEPPSAKEFNILLQNSLLGLKVELVLVLDDYHYITDERIHDLINSLFEFQIPGFKMVLISRKDPDLNLSNWRKKNLLLEIRSKQLRFNNDEIAEMYKTYFGTRPNVELTEAIYRNTEGWVLLVKLLLQESKSPESLALQLSEFQNEPTHFITELMTEFIDKNPIDLTNQMLALSLVNEFNGDIYCELCLDEHQKKDCNSLFKGFMDHLKNFGIVIVQSDQKNGWFRFHHLFLDFLKSKQQDFLSQLEILNLNRKMAFYSQKNDNHYKAIEHYLRSEEVSRAIQCFSKYRIRLIGASKYEELIKAFELFSIELVNDNIELQVTRGWLLFHSGNLTDMQILLEGILENSIDESENYSLPKYLKGEIHAMLSYSKYLVSGDIPSSLTHSQKAIEVLTNTNPSALGIAWIFYSSSMRALGHSEIVKKEILMKLRASDNPIFKGYLLIALYFLHWFDGELDTALVYARNILEAGQIKGSKFLLAMGHTFAGLIYYNQGKNDQAVEHLRPAYNFRYYANLRHSLVGGIAYIHLLNLNRKTDEARNAVEEFERIALNKGDQMFIKLINSTKAIHGIGLGKGGSIHWAEDNDYYDFLPESSLYSPELTQAVILTSSNNKNSWKTGLDICDMMHEFFLGRRNINGRVRVLAIMATIRYKLDEKEISFMLLKEALRMAEIGHYSRPFLLLKEHMHVLLRDFLSNRNDPYANEVLQELERETEMGRPVSLSTREKEVLEMSADMTNAELASALFISEKTVKVHITNINKKLKTSNKKEALEKAFDLELLN